MKHLIIVLIYVIVTSSTFAQKKQNIYYFNQQDVEVTNPDSSYYSRVIQEPDSGSTFFNLIEFYKDRKVKSRGKVSEFNPNLIFQETLVRNFPNGKKASISTFKNGVLTGSEYLYFESGVLKEERFYLENKEKTYNPKRIIYKTVSLHDTAGQNFLDENGSGLVNIEEENGDWQKAIYLNGLKTGVWESYNKKENETYSDLYQDGLYISGKTTKANGEIISYQEIEKLPEFKGGLSAFGRFLGENLRYPPDAARDGIQGRIYISFVVEKDGTFSELKIAKGVRQDLDDEALRVVKLSPIWNPALKRGIPQKTSYTFPVFFQLDLKY